MLAVVTRTTTLLPQAVAQRSVAEQQGKNAVESFVAMPECGCGAKAAASATAFPLAKAGRGGSKVWNPPSTTFLQSGAGSQMVSEYADAASATYTAGTQAGTASDTGATQLYQHADHLTTRLTTDNSNDTSNVQRHYPYGEAMPLTSQEQQSNTADPSVLRKYTTYLKDEEATAGALNYAVFREHSPRIGRFNMADPVERRAGDPKQFNSYVESTDDPVNGRNEFVRIVEWCPIWTNPLCQWLDPEPPGGPIGSDCPRTRAGCTGGGGAIPVPIVSVFNLLDCIGDLSVTVTDISCRAGLATTTMRIVGFNRISPPRIDRINSVDLRVRPQGAIGIASPIVGGYFYPLFVAELFVAAGPPNAVRELTIQWSAQWTCRGITQRAEKTIVYGQSCLPRT